MNHKFTISDYLYYAFFIFCIFLFVLGFILETSFVVLGISVSGMVGFLVFAYLHKFFERKFLAYIITLALMVFTVIAFSLKNIILMAVSILGAMILCAIIWILGRIRDGKRF